MKILLFVGLLLVALGAMPTWPYSRSWGYYPSGGLGLVAYIVAWIIMPVDRGAPVVNSQTSGSTLATG